MNRPLPAFLGIGAQRAGTSWLYNQLSLHPDIWMPPVKEIHYFDRSPSYASPNDLATASPYSRILGSKPWERPRITSGIKTIAGCCVAGRIQQALWWADWTFGFYNDAWYRRLFSQAASAATCGEITPSYSILEEKDIAGIKSLNPDMKIIFILRNPVERAWSAVRFHVQHGAEIHLDSPEEIISVLKHPGMSLRGDYERTLDRYLKFFDPSQILVCFYDAIQSEPVNLMAAITTFLAVRPFDESRIHSGMLVNKAPDHEMPPQVKEHLVETYAPMIGRLADRLGSYAALWKEAGEGSTPDRTEGPPDKKLIPAVHPSSPSAI